MKIQSEIKGNIKTIKSLNKNMGQYRFQEMLIKDESDVNVERCKLLWKNLHFLRSKVNFTFHFSKKKKRGVTKQLENH